MAGSIKPNPPKCSSETHSEKAVILSQDAVSNKANPQNLGAAPRPKIVSRVQVVARANSLDGTIMFDRDNDFPGQAVFEARVGYSLRSEKTPKGGALSIGPGDPLTATRLTLRQGTSNTNLKSVRGKYKFVPAAELKSDVIKIHGRRIVEIAAGGEKYSGTGPKINASSGAVHIIAGNRKGRLQKMVLGGNLVAALKDIMARIAQMNESIRAVESELTFLKTGLAAHVHTPIFSPSANLCAALGVEVPTTTVNISNNIGTTCNNEIIKVNWLEPTSPKYILSHWNKVN